MGKQNDIQSFEFPVVLFGKLEPINETISKGRCRIFYKGPNRNGSYITDQFAEKLLKSLPYTPIKGIYDGCMSDYEDHGEKNSDGRIYGIVPENPNVTWEEHQDSDGQIRIYATADVYVFTALYEEAQEVFTKAQSMELYIPSIVGDWQFIKGQKYFVFEDGCFLGLQILGDEVEPCFEGAAFFSLYDSLKAAIDKIEKNNMAFKKQSKGGTKMRINFNLGEPQAFEALHSLLNPNFTEEGSWTLDFCICEIAENYVIAKNLKEDCFTKIGYLVEEGNYSLGEQENCFMINVSEAEKTSLDAVKAQNGDSFEKAEEIYSTLENLQNTISDLNNTISELNGQISGFEQKIEEGNNTIATLTTERDTANENYANAQAEVTTLTEENEGLKTYKLNIENNEKLAVIAAYDNKLSDDVLESYRGRVSEFSLDELKKDLAFNFIETNPSIFSNQSQPQYVPKDNVVTGGIEEILAKYKK